MSELKVSEKQALVRKEAINLVVPEGAVQIGTSTYVLPVEYGFAKVVISAVKETPDFDLDKLAEEYRFLAHQKAEAKAAKEAEKAAKA